jgi:protein-S-isoprenylcysteine O-methyltransferase Ste14
MAGLGSLRGSTVLRPRSGVPHPADRPGYTRADICLSDVDAEGHGLEVVCCWGNTSHSELSQSPGCGPRRKCAHFNSHGMTDTTDTANVIVRPPLAWALAVLAGFGLNWLTPVPFVPATTPGRWLGAAVFVFALALVAWAIATMSRAGSNVPTNQPTTTIVETGPYRFTRNPIYLGMVLGFIGLAVAFNSFWLLVTLVPFALVIRYGVVAREEAYLESSSATSTAATARACAAGCSA